MFIKQTVMKAITLSLLTIGACKTSVIPITAPLPMENNVDINEEITPQNKAELEQRPLPHQTVPTNCSQDLIDEAIRWNAECIPRPTAVKVSGTYNSWSMLPNHVMVNRCSGGCHSPKECIPSAQSMIAIPLLTGDCGLKTGQCNKSCSYVNIPIHTKCTCSCQRRNELCPRETHEYSNDTSSCLSPKSEEEVTYTDPGLHWDKLCKCLNTIININPSLEWPNQEGKYVNLCNNRILLLITFAALALALTTSLTLLSTKCSTFSTPISTLSIPSVIDYRREHGGSKQPPARWSPTEPGPLSNSEAYDILQEPQVLAIRKSSRI